MAKKVRPDSYLSFRLEESIPVPYKVLGTPEWIKQTIPVDFPRASLIEVRGSSQIEPVRRLFEAERVLAVDTESSGPREMDGLDAVSPTSEIVLGQIGTRQEMFVIEPRLLPEFAGILQSDHQLKLLQNAVHDFRFLMAKFGIHLVKIYCSMLAEQVLTAGKEGIGVSMADLVRKYRPHHIISKATRNEFICFKGKFTTNMLYYAARDVSLMFPVYDAQRVLLRHYEMEGTAKLEFQIIPAMAEMGLSGVLCDPAYLRQTIEYYQRQHTKVTAQIFELYNQELDKMGLTEVGLLGPEWQTWNLKSHQETKARLRKINIVVDKTDYDTVIQLDHPLGKPLADLSGINKVLDNYGDTMLKRIHWHTRRIHPNFDQLGAGENAQRNGKDKKETIATGRMSGDFQQLPRPEHILEALSDLESTQIRAAFADRILEIENQSRQAAA